MQSRSAEGTRDGQSSGDRQTEVAVGRRTALKLTGVLGATVVGGLGTGTGVASAQSAAWTVVVVPDTQKYARRSSLVSYAQDQTDWIAANLATENIVFVTHEGDWVDDGSNRTEWERMDTVWNAIEGDVPYAAAIGDHDYAVEEDRSSSTANYREFFGEARYGGYSWFGGSAPNDLSHYQYFSAGGYDFLHIDLEWEAPGDPTDATSAVGWAQGVLDAHPDTPTIITTHSYLWDEPGEEGRTTFVQENSNDGNSGEQLFRKLVEPNPQVFMTFNGNFHEAGGSDNGEWTQVSQNAAGRDVYELLACYQDYPNGGDGWLRLVRFVPGGGTDGLDRIAVQTYSPSLDAFQTDGRSEFSFDLDFTERFGASDGGTETVTFETGLDGYDGTVDTYLQEAQPDADNATAPTLNVDTNDPQGTGQAVQALLRFDGVVGTDGGIPLGATVTSATLTLQTTGDGDGAGLYPMLVGWSDHDSWDSLGGGVQVDGAQAAATPDVTTGSVALGTTTVDVTASVERWVGGDPNYGWLFRATGSDGWDFSSAEGTTPPRLRVTFESGSGDPTLLTVPQAVARANPDDDDSVIDQIELQLAINWWATETAVPNTGGQTLTTAELQQLTNMWATGATVA
ncbi:Calcineurin-like phosphoesterase [Halogranum gelatinilyticum]|uniref:Calcineurin-like phosphoesterase n=1 Tax=Halogranum gelatinilyticum TaxID=660521 RepID=A0A1G9SMC5_9EURY|nr:DNRLRE domain-containing protein [Halogranum gelatinilyticum]SDM36477.1 Calcineurin-like phosphoesterase [Halogranum gelatinilyticum]